MKNLMVSKILLVDNDPDMPVGMGGYGVRFERQRDYYIKLSRAEKQQYQEAILQLCQSADVREANLGLYTAVELRDVFLDGWVEQIRKVIDALIRRPIIPQYTNTASYAIFWVIFTYGDETVLPFVTAYIKEITQNLEEHTLSRRDWLLFYPFVCQILIKISPVEFWKEFDAFCENENLLAIVGEDAKSVIRRWAGMGAHLYGVEWLEQLAQRCVEIHNISLKSWAYQAIKESVGRIEEKDKRALFLGWLEIQFR